jgi:hypothetical protein
MSTAVVASLATWDDARDPLSAKTWALKVAEPRPTTRLSTWRRED